MIWIWASAGFILTALLLRKKDVRWYHYIWALLPIDQYGISIGGATIKPYMMFIIPLLFVGYKHRIRIQSKQAIFFLFFSFSFLLSDVANGFVIQSVLQRIYFLIIVIEGWLYSSAITTKEEYQQIPYAIKCSVVGYGLVCLIGQSAFMLGYTGIPGLVSDTSISGALIKLYSTMQGTNLIQTYRLHGFECDPNAFTLLYIVGFVLALYNIIFERKERKLNITVMTISSMCIWFSNSRGAMLTCIIMLVLALFYYQNTHKNISAFGLFISVISLVGLLLILIDTQQILDLVLKLLSKSGRSMFNDKYGRLSIWKENLNNMLRLNPLFGVGANQSRLYSSISRACHNSWLEWICASGVLMGLASVFVFFRPLTFIFKRNNTLGSLITSIGFAYISLVIMLFSIDYFANTYLLILFVLFYWREDKHTTVMRI